MRLDVWFRQLKVSKATLGVGVCVAGAGAIVAVMLFGASATPGDASATQPSTPTPVQSPAEPAPVSVPSTAGGARSSGIGGATWASGDASQLGAEFRRSVAHQFGGGSMGQARMAMAGLGFQCTGSGGKMECEKSMQADNCTLTWSVKLKGSDGAVSGAGGEGFSRNCS
jgi:hypothetical protein